MAKPDRVLGLPLQAERAQAARRRSIRVAIGVIGSVLVSALVAYGVTRENERTAAHRFDLLAANFADRVKDKLETYRFGLLAARGAVIAAGGEAISFDAFRRYAATRDFAAEFPGFWP